MEFDTPVPATPRSKPRLEKIHPLTETQKVYDNAIRSARVVFGMGPAGTGKTWFATMRAAEALEEGLIEKIILTRPVIEAGERLGFLPGDMKEKVDPYMQPLYDALEEKFGAGHLEYMIKRKVIEVRPLAFMRGSTIKNAWLIGDEMQNATPLQMKMLLTRIGEGAKFIITGDPRQNDLPGACGLIDAVETVRGISKVQVVRFSKTDVVRDGICQEIVEAYES